ncbi:hypothetical protein DRJ16_07385, partial [Candidatus Woesearchaeota archaeon]
ELRNMEKTTLEKLKERMNDRPTVTLDGSLGKLKVELRMGITRIQKVMMPEDAETGEEERKLQKYLIDNPKERAKMKYANTQKYGDKYLYLVEEVYSKAGVDRVKLVTEKTRRIPMRLAFEEFLADTEVKQVILDGMDDCEEVAEYAWALYQHLIERGTSALVSEEEKDFLSEPSKKEKKSRGR